MKNRNKWGFQLSPTTRDVLGVGYRVDPLTKEIEDEVDNTLPYRFRFHGISKLVIKLGPSEKEKDYVEGFGVALKHYPDFDIYEYKDLPSEEKTKVMRRIILDVFDWLIHTFEDAQTFQVTKEKLKWS